ncbi:MAG: type II secretion system protein [Deltaproteobacteria bacterium]|nr:type II secretion system protein [Deltaproteobacteria bacterium]
MGNIIEGKQGGFTLIEIVAVLVLLGIAAAIAVPKYFDMMQGAEKKALQHALTEMQSRACSEFSQSLILHDGRADITDTDSFDDLNMGSDSEVLEILDGFQGTWSYISETEISYSFKHGPKTATFRLIPGTETEQPMITMNIS